MSARPKSAAVVLFLLALALAACVPAATSAAPQPALSLTAAPVTLTCGASADLTVAGAAPGGTLSLYRKRASDADFAKIADVTAGPDGTFGWSTRPTETTVFRVEQAAGQSWEAATAETTIGVRHRVTLTAKAATPLIEDKYVRYTVTLRPAHAGATAQVQHWTGDGWVALAEVKLGDDSVGAVRLPAGKPGALVVRAQVTADGAHLAGNSRTWKRMVYDHRNPYGVPTEYPHLIVVDLSKYKLYYHEHGVVVRVFDCVLGRPSLPTPKGHYKIYAKDPHMGGAYGPFRMRYLGLYAIHGTNEPWLLSRFPRNYSHGCTRLADSNITWLYQRVHVGTPVWNVP